MNTDVMETEVRSQKSEEKRKPEDGEHGWDIHHRVTEARSQAELGPHAGNGVLESWSSAGTRNGELAAKERREHKGDEFNREIGFPSPPRDGCPNGVVR